MTTHTIDTTNSAGCSPCTPEAHQRSGDEKLRRDLSILNSSWFDPNVLNIRHTPGNLVKIEHELTEMLQALSEKKAELERAWDEMVKDVEAECYMQNARSSLLVVHQHENDVADAVMFGNPVSSLIKAYCEKQSKRETIFWESDQDGVFPARYVLMLGRLIQHELRAIWNLTRSHDYFEISKKIDSKPLRKH